MKQILALMMAMLLLCTLSVVSAEEKKLNIVATTFPLYDWTRAVLGDRVNQVNLSLLQESGVDLHNFQPTAQDFVKVSSADLLIYIGGSSDAWAEDAIREAQNKDMVALSMVEALGDSLKMAVSVEGMQEGDHHHDHDDHDHDKDHDHDDHDDKHDHDDHDDHDDKHDHDDHDDKHDHDSHEHSHEDEHVWLSLRNAQVLTGAIAEALAQKDPAHAETYRQNQAAYAKQLSALDKQYQQAVAQAGTNTLLFGDRFPFRYLTDDYGLSYYAAFSGCSAESEASFETIAFLAQKTDELKLPAVLSLDGSDGRIAKAVLNASRDAARPVLVLDAMQTVSKAMVEEGVTYLGIMEKNLDVLKTALK